MLALYGFSRCSRLASYAIGVAMLLVSPVQAGPASVESAEVAVVGADSYRFRVTVRHADAGWKHYADRWEVVSLQGKVLATRVLHHPHDNEQPFTRELTDVRLPKGERWVVIRAHDKMHGYGGAEIKLDLSQARR